MIKTTREFIGHKVDNRYAYDFGLCSSKDGWAQVDTTEDAPWFGQWANPFERQVISYAEGDQTRIECDTDAEFVAELDRIAAFHCDKDQWKGIDDTWNERVSRGFIAAGAAHLLYTTTRTSPLVVIDGADRQAPELVAQLLGND